MEETTKETSTPSSARNTIESLSKEELFQKYKGLLGIAKKAKQAKDELAEENRQLKESLARSETQKEADKKALVTMKEMVEEFTANKLELVTQLNELQNKSRADEDSLAELRIENESLNRQLNRLNEDNETLLADIDRMEGQLKKVNLLGLEQKKHLELLEHEVNKLKEAESLNVALQSKVAVTLEENKSLKDKENEAKRTLDELLSKYNHVKEVNTEQRHKFNSLKDRFVDVHHKLKKLKECKRVLLETQHEYAESVTKWQNEIIKASRLLCGQMNKLKKENENLLEKLQMQKHDDVDGGNQSINLDKIVQKLQELETLSEIAYEEHKQKKLKEKSEEKFDIEAMKLNMKRLTQEAQDLKVQLKQKEELNVNLENELKEIVSKIGNLEHDCGKLNEEKNVLQEDLRKAFELNAEEKRVRDEQFAAKMDESKKLHDDLQRIQEALKALEEERLNLLHANEKQQSEEEKKLEDDMNVKASYEELLARYEQKERENADLLSEMRELNEALKSRGDMISRQQEKQQELSNELRKTTAKLKQIETDLKQKEESIIEKDKQVTSISEEIDSTRQKVSKLENACAKNEEQVRVLTEELQSMRCHEQSSPNVADSQSDVLSTSTISRADELNRLREVDDSFEEKYNKLRGLAVKLKKKLQEQTAQMAEMEQKQSEANASAVKKELEECKTKMEKLLSEQDQNQKQIDSLKAENQKLKQSRKQASVLNLEIEAAEKSLSEASSKLAVKINELETIKEAVESKENTIEQLHKEISLLEMAKEAECAHSKELKDEIDRLQQQIKDAVHSKQNVMITQKELEHAHENLKLEAEDLKLQLSNSNSKQETILAAVQADKEQLEQKLLQTEETLKSTQKNLKTTEHALEDLRVEYLEYKVKAQSVLRKNQTKDISVERELEEELQSLRAVEKKLQEEIASQARISEDSDKQIALLQEDNVALEQRTKDLLNIIEELRVQNDNLSLECRNQVQQQQETLKAHRCQIESLNACHKAQLEDVETKLKCELDQLKAEHAKAMRLPPVIGAASHTPPPTQPPTNQTIPLTHQNKIDFLLMEREDAEGSEEADTQPNRKISTSSRRSQHEFMPLDELLNTPMNAISDTVTILNSDNLGHNDPGVDANGNRRVVEKMHVELNATKERLQIQESRVRHLTSLLAENEQDLAKLTQMNDMLKEELRRQERAVEREQHMHNSEYLKNVIIKFLTLSNGDERTRLVPVLNTILKLSRNETEVLNCVAKGQKVSTEGNSRGWSNFLPSWSSSSN